jgi:hypothetical protein
VLSENPPPGSPGHDHWGGPRPDAVPPSIWVAYGDRYPGSYCRWLTDSTAGQAELERRRRQREAEALWLRVQRTVEALAALQVPAQRIDDEQKADA